MGNKKKTQEGNEPKSIRGWIALLIPCLIAFLGIVYRGQIDLKIQESKEGHEVEMYERQNACEQHFYCNASVVNKFGIDYVQYEFTSDPIVAGYHVLLYPYLVYGNEQDGKDYIPVMGQFVQNEYKADMEGCCKLYKENTSRDFLKLVNTVVDDPVDIKALVAIQYTEDGESKERRVYDVRDGQLVEADIEVVVEVLQAWEKEDGRRIDLWGWPCFDRQKLIELFG